MLKIKPGSLMIDPQFGFESRSGVKTVLNSSADILEDDKEVGKICFSITLFAPYKIDISNYHAIATDLIRYEEIEEKRGKGKSKSRRSSNILT